MFVHYSSVQYQRTSLFGGPGGNAFDDISSRTGPQIVGMRSLRVRHGAIIDAIQAEYVLTDGTTVLGNRNGGGGGGESIITFVAGEVITEVRGSTGVRIW